MIRASKEDGEDWYQGLRRWVDGDFRVLSGAGVAAGGGCGGWLAIKGFEWCEGGNRWWGFRVLTVLELFTVMAGCGEIGQSRNILQFLTESTSKF